MSFVSVLPSQLPVRLPLFRSEFLLLLGPLKSLCALSPPKFVYNALRGTSLQSIFNHALVSPGVCLFFVLFSFFFFETFNVSLFSKEITNTWLNVFPKPPFPQQYHKDNKSIVLRVLNIQ